MTIKGLISSARLVIMGKCLNLGIQEFRDLGIKKI
jgi:hypothetical protein